MALSNAQDLESSKSNAPRAEFLYDEIVHVIVGPAREKFGFHRGLLFHYASYFRPYFSVNLDGSAEEAIPGELLLEEDEVETFRLFNTWLYSQELPRILTGTDKDRDWHQLSHLYVFADMRLVPKLKNDILDRILVKYTDFQGIPLYHITYIYANAPTSSPLRKLVADLFSCTPDIDKVDEEDTEFLLTSTPKEFLWDLAQSLFESRSPMRTLRADLLTCNEEMEKLDEKVTLAFFKSTPRGFLWDLAQALCDSRAQHLPVLEMVYFRREVCRYHEHRKGERCVTGEPVQADVAGIKKRMELMSLDGES